MEYDIEDDMEDDIEAEPLQPAHAWPRGAIQIDMEFELSSSSSSDSNRYGSDATDESVCRNSREILQKSGNQSLIQRENDVVATVRSLRKMAALLEDIDDARVGRPRCRMVMDAHTQGTDGFENCWHSNLRPASLVLSQCVHTHLTHIGFTAWK